MDHSEPEEARGGQERPGSLRGDHLSAWGSSLPTCMIPGCEVQLGVGSFGRGPCARRPRDRASKEWTAVPRAAVSKLRSHLLEMLSTVDGGEEPICPLSRAFVQPPCPLRGPRKHLPAVYPQPLLHWGREVSAELAGPAWQSFLRCSHRCPHRCSLTEGVMQACALCPLAWLSSHLCSLGQWEDWEVSLN